jgi:hypothetical protein
VLEIVRNNYETLTLKLEDDLDQYERYTENPNETSYFTNIVRIKFYLKNPYHLLMTGF